MARKCLALLSASNEQASPQDSALRCIGHVELIQHYFFNKKDNLPFLKAATCEVAAFVHCLPQVDDPSFL